jgi:hypothetical protein
MDKASKPRALLFRCNHSTSSELAFHSIKKCRGRSPSWIVHERGGERSTYPDWGGAISGHHGAEAAGDDGLPRRVVDQPARQGKSLREVAGALGDWDQHAWRSTRCDASACSAPLRSAPNMAWLKTGELPVIGEVNFYPINKIVNFRR